MFLTLGVGPHIYMASKSMASEMEMFCAISRLRIQKLRFKLFADLDMGILKIVQQFIRTFLLRIWLQPHKTRHKAAYLYPVIEKVEHGLLHGESNRDHLV